MAIAAGGAIVGSISGGCVEAALAAEAAAVLRDGRPRMLAYGLTDEDAQAVGLHCGGTLHVVLTSLDPDETAAFARRAAAETLVAETMRLDAAGLGRRLAVFAGSTFGTLGDPHLDEVVASEARAGASESTEIRTFGERGEPHGSVRVFVRRALPKPDMYVFGAIDVAQAMVRAGQFLGYAVTVCDARPAFATRERFPEADAVAVAWPDDFLRRAPVDERTAIVSLTHDEKFDPLLIRAALETPAGYIGVMGSRRTTERRLAELRAEGLAEAQLARLRAPIGLDIGARTPEETALAIAAEIVAQRHGRTGGALTGGSGPLRGGSTGARR